MSLDPLAEPKAIGEDVETLVVDAIDGLEAAADSEDWYDAVATTVIGPRTGPDRLVFGSIPVVVGANEDEDPHGDRAGSAYVFPI